MAGGARRAGILSGSYAKARAEGTEKALRLQERARTLWA